MFASLPTRRQLTSCDVQNLINFKQYPGRCVVRTSETPSETANRQTCALLRYTFCLFNIVPPLRDYATNMY